MPEDSVLTDNSTSISPAGLGFTFVMCCLLLGLPRRWAFLPIILLICFMTMGERLIIAGLDFPMLRILMLVGWVRVILRGEVQVRQWNAIDKTIVAFLISSIITYTILWGTVEAFINRLGMAYNLIGGYFLFRVLVRDINDFVRVCKTLAVCVIPLAGTMFIEKLSGRNLFAMFGGVPLISEVRNGAIRCQGPFAHSILAGSFGATLFPLFVALWCQGGDSRALSIMAILSSIVIVLTSASSGPMLAFLAGGLALSAWPLRKHMRAIRWGVFITVIGMEIVMKAHVWFLIARLDIVSGSTSYYRAYLIDRFIVNFSDWWLLGIKSTGVWADADLGLHDRTNQYIVVAADGGLSTLILFVLVIAYCFRSVGRTLQAMRKESPQLQFLIWALGASLFCHAVNFVSVSYFDQNSLNWYLLLAMISAAFLSAHDPRKRKGPSRLGAIRARDLANTHGIQFLPSLGR